MVVDATGLRVYGSGEGHVRKHRHGRHRAWRKLHLGVDERTKEIVAVEVTPSRVHDCRLLPKGRATKLMLDDRRAEIVDYLNKGVSKRSVAKILGCSPTTLYSWILRRRISGR